MVRPTAEWDLHYVRGEGWRTTARTWEIACRPCSEGGCQLWPEAGGALERAVDHRAGWSTISAIDDELLADIAVDGDPC